MGAVVSWVRAPVVTVVAAASLVAAGGASASATTGYQPDRLPRG